MMKNHSYKILFSLLFFCFATAWLANNYGDSTSDKNRSEQSEKSIEDKSIEEKDKTYIIDSNQKNHFQITLQEEKTNHLIYYDFIIKEWSAITESPPPKTLHLTMATKNS